MKMLCYDMCHKACCEMWQCADNDHDGFVDMTELEAFLKKC
jgi:hypothetical protein